MAPDLRTFPLTGPISLVVRLGHGTVTVTAREGLAEATVRLTPRDTASDVLRRVTVGLQASTLRVTGPRQGGAADLIGGWRRDRDGIDAELDVPTGTPVTIVTIVTASADIVVAGRCGDTDIATGAAGITLDTVAGDLRLRYGRADARVGTVTGSAQVRAGGGTVHFGDVGNRLQCGFGTADLSADVVRGELRVRAGSGSAQVGAAYGNLDVAYGSGPVSIGLPAGLAAQVDVSSGAGRVHSDLPVERSAAPGGQHISVRARTGHGDVRLLRAGIPA